MTRVLRAAIAMGLATAAVVRARWVAASHVGTSVAAGVKILGCSMIQITDRGVLRIAQGVTVGMGVTLTAKGGSLVIGERSEIGPWCTIVAQDEVEIGNDCLIAERVSIRDQDHEIRSRSSVPIRLAGMRVAPVRLGNDVWVGAGAVVLKGVTIGQGAVVAANSVVNRDVQPFEIVGGVPARHIGYRLE